MIKYNAVQNKYLYKTEDIDKIIDTIEGGFFYDLDNCTQEKVAELAKTIEDFMSNIQIVKEEVELKRHETEEEAREYFGQDFIDKFDKLLTTLDNEETIVTIHGAPVGGCPGICEKGLIYKSPSINSAAYQQQMNYGQKEMHYGNYEGLLNWKHKDYKGLVIVAIPYECYYKEGLWNHFQNTDAGAYGIGDYNIDPDFIVGYIDVENKQIILNDKYNRKHDYTGYVKDSELFREQLDMNNSKLKQELIELEQQKDEDYSNYSSQNNKGTYDISMTPYTISDLIGLFNSIKLAYPNGMTESGYNRLLKELSNGFNEVLKNISLLKTDEELRKEQEKREAMINTIFGNGIPASDDEYVWDDSGINK